MEDNRQSWQLWERESVDEAEAKDARTEGNRTVILPALRRGGRGPRWRRLLLRGGSRLRRPSGEVARPT
jgi:hypothetical protein